MAGLNSEQQHVERQHMLQALLEDRFKLKTHWETKEDDVYNLVVAKGQPKLSAEGSMQPSKDEVKILGSIRYRRSIRKTMGRDTTFWHGCSIGQLVSASHRSLDGP